MIERPRPASLDTHLLDRAQLPRLVVASAVVVFLLVGVLATRPFGDATPDADAAAAAARGAGRGRPHQPPVVPAPQPAKGANWSGYAFDACRTPSQGVMDRWRTASPFSGVGIYLGGIHRACAQPHLTPQWVRRQLRADWQLLPIWVGPQASCTGYDHRIAPRAGSARRFGLARRQGLIEARRAARAARGLGIPRAQLIYYDIEPFDAGIPACRGSSLAFLEAWTREMHRRGYRSGVYSHVKAAISLISRTGPGYSRPDAVWYAWIDRVGTMPRDYVANPAFMRAGRVHQYALDERVRFGGVRMDIDWDFVSLGATSRPAPTLTCDAAANAIRPVRLRAGSRGRAVRVIQCLVGRLHPAKTTGRFDATTARAVQRFQARRGLSATGTVDRRTWTALLVRGNAPVLRKGARGGAVQRLQRGLKAALGPSHVRVDGSFGRGTARAVARYRGRLGLSRKPVVTPAVWHALGRGKVAPRRR